MSSTEPEIGLVEPPELAGDGVVLVPLRPEHIEPLAAMIAEPAVTRWWSDPPDWVQKRLIEPDPEALGFAVLSLPAREVIGYIQAWENADPEFRSAGLDLYLGTAHQGRGYGPAAIRAAIRWLIEARGHHRITIDPALANERAIRAYEKVGFRRVGVLRQYALEADGSWQDGLLMDLLAEEFSPD
jgi:aminoglycoside 6'-N-acetyltransferase